MRNVCKYFVGAILVIALGVPPLAGPLHARDSYKKVLKKWTRHDTVYVVDNLEARLDWNATYLSPEFREAQAEKIAELREEVSAVGAGLPRSAYDEFFIGAYAGSSAWSGFGKNTGDWNIVLEAAGDPPVRPLRFERVPVGQMEKILYPYLRKWDQAYRVKFPKVVQPGQKFVLRMTGIPARSELVWK